MSSLVPGARLKRAEPQRPQKSFSKPPSGAQTRSSSFPETSRTLPGSARPFADADVPERRWQRLQWQYDAERSGFASSKRRAPQPQAPVRTARRAA